MIFPAEPCQSVSLMAFVNARRSLGREDFEGYCPANIPKIGTTRRRQGRSTRPYGKTHTGIYGQLINNGASGIEHVEKRGTGRSRSCIIDIYQRNRRCAVGSKTVWPLYGNHLAKEHRLGLFLHDTDPRRSDTLERRRQIRSRHYLVCWQLYTGGDRGALHRDRTRRQHCPLRRVQRVSQLALRQEHHHPLRQRSLYRSGVYRDLQVIALGLFQCAAYATLPTTS